jgi:Tol biopolymer transport system component
VIETASGTYLYYSTNYFTGNQDIYRSTMRADGTFGPGERLPYPVNTEYDDRQPNLSQDGREIVFASDRRTAGTPGANFDIFYAKRGRESVDFPRVINLSESVPFDTLDASETRPSLSWDSERLVYGSGGVWQSDRR